MRDVLNRDWDPIRVFPEVKDEYDGYAVRIVRLLIDGADTAKIATLLTSIERTQMGYDQALETLNLPVAEELVRLFAHETESGEESKVWGPLCGQLVANTIARSAVRTLRETRCA